MSVYGLSSGNVWSLGSISYSFNIPSNVSYYDRDEFILFAKDIRWQ